MTQTVKNQVIYVTVRTVLFILWPLPVRALELLGRGLAFGVYLLGIAPRRVALENLERVYPALPEGERRALALRVYLHLGTYLGATVADVLRPGRRAPLPFEEGSREVLTAALGEGTGVLFASAHLGPWEQVGSSLVRHGFPLTTLARESYDPRFMQLYDRLRGRAGVRAIYRGSASSAPAILRTLRRGLLGAPMDLRSRVASIEAPFLGHPARTAVGPARLALRTAVPVVVGTAMRQRAGQVVLRVTRIRTDDLVRGAPGEEELTRRLNDEIATRIRAFPEGWVWMHPRWVPGEAAPDANSAPS